MKAKIKINKEDVISKIDNRLFGSFIEHLGRAVYGGIYEKDHETADDCGFRQDVLNAIKELNVPIVRYPGGNFVSGFYWEDSVGDRAKRPHKMDLAWGTIETNEIGIDEFQEWAKRVNAEVMMAVNLGTRGPMDARNLVEYCNLNTDTYYANMRKANGHEEPYGIKVWCLGNEMDGPWQIGAKTPQEYARIATETAKVMKWTDPSIELVACGSSSPTMETFGTWEREVLRGAYENIDYMSLHCYYGNPDNDTKKYLASSLIMDNFIKEVVDICDEVKKEKNSDKTVNLSFDEWNVWFHSNEADKEQEKWQIAPPLLEDVYNLEDALVVGSLINTLIKHSDRVKIAALAQLVNVIAPIMTKTGGGMWLQTIYYPFYYASTFGRGFALNATCECDTYAAGDPESEEYKKNNFGHIPYIDSSVTMSEDKESISVFLVNRSLDEEVELELEGFDGYKISSHVELTHDDLKAINTIDNPEEVVAKEKNISDKVVLSSKSWNMIKFSKC